MVLVGTGTGVVVSDGAAVGISVEITVGEQAVRNIKLSKESVENRGILFRPILSFRDYS